ncbi:MAG: hypothetical protein QM642_01315 [Edaphocola sp.]
MNEFLNNLSSIPEWTPPITWTTEVGDQWKHRESRKLIRALYEKWREIMASLNGVNAWCGEADSPFAEMMQGHLKCMLGNGMIVAVKIKGAAAADLYVNKMENATIIRQHAMGIAAGLSLLEAEGAAELHHVAAIRADISEFRCLFLDWTATFERDDYKDEWGLFN